MERDEEGTFRRVLALRTEVIDPLLAEHRGRLVKTTGDGMLAEFASPLVAVIFALKLQKSLNDQPDGLRLRIGINLGDIIVEEDGDVYGEGVNIAARLEALCEPGGILVSSKIHSEVYGKLSALFEDRGEKHVKNISKLVHVFSVREAPEGTIPEAPVRRRIGLASWLTAALTASTLVLGGIVLFWFLRAPAERSAASARPSSTHEFDGLWKLTISCPPSETPKAAAYTMKLAVQVTEGRLFGELGRPGKPGAFAIQGTMRPDGTALLTARGISDAVAGAGAAPAGSIFEYTATARFADNRGTGKRIETRLCDLTFER
jgi:hypothetical protein